MPTNDDWKWRADLMGLVGEIRNEQTNLSDKLDEYCKSSEGRFERLEHTVYGNGQPGLSEQVRNVRGRVAIATAGAAVVITAAVNAVFKYFATPH